MCIVVSAIALLAFPSGAEEPRREPVVFPAGASATKVEGQIQGYETVDHLVSAKAGQTLEVELATDNRSSCFNVISPDADAEAAFVGSVSGNHFSGRLDRDGDWKLRVYLMRNAARREEVARYALQIDLTSAPDPEATRRDGTRP